MKCVVCKHEKTVKGETSVTLERDSTTLVIKGVPAQVCPNCGEAYVDDETTRKLLQTANDAAKNGVRVEIRDYMVA